MRTGRGGFGGKGSEGKEVAEGACVAHVLKLSVWGLEAGRQLEIVWFIACSRNRCWPSDLANWAYSEALGGNREGERETAKRGRHVKRIGHILV